MKKTILIIFALMTAFAGCREHDGKGSLPVRVDLENIEFTPIAGGAIMSYILPDDGRVYGIKASFRSVITGGTETAIGTYGGTELTLRGFIEAESSVTARLSLIGFDGSESKAVETTFSTLAASAMTVFDNLSVTPYWGGFSVAFDAPYNADGFVNVGYIGLDPVTQKDGVILVDTKVMEGGSNKFNFGGIPDRNGEIEAVIWTEDFAGNEVRRESFDIEPFIVTRHDPAKMSYSGNSMENTDRKVGWQYLFDGDLKGTRRLADRNQNFFHLFLTQDDPVMRPEGIIDLGEARQLASFRMYALLNTDIATSSIMWTIDGNSTLPYWANNFKLYASNDNVEWTEITEYYQDPTLPREDWWCYQAGNPNAVYHDVDMMEAADPCYVEVTFDVMDAEYRYLKIEFINTFIRPMMNARVAAVEMEVYVAE